MLIRPIILKYLIEIIFEIVNKKLILNNIKIKEEETFWLFITNSNHLKVKIHFERNFVYFGTFIKF